MYVKALELNGFKSFAKKTTLSLDAPVIAIVGPNGSGKSNIAEAMRFVLGEQSIKSMRGKRGEDLIWNGSKAAARLGRASVSLVFDNRPTTNGTRVFDMDYDEVILTREVHRDGQNEYRINGSKARLRDVFEMLASAHIGSSAHHIISQGETDRLLTASIRERREMIEDALGLRIYEYKIGESEKKLTKTGENIREAELLVKELAPRIHFLKKQMERLEKARKLRDTLSLLYKEYFKREEVYLLGAKNAIEESRKIPKEKLQEIEDVIDGLKKTLDESTGGSAHGEDALRMEREMRVIREKKDEFSRALGRLEGMIEIETEAQARRTALASDEGVSPESEVESGVLVPAGKVREFANIVRGLLDEALSRGNLEEVKETLARVKEKIHHFVEKLEEKHSVGFGKEAAEAKRQEVEMLLASLREQKDETAEKLRLAKEEEIRIFAEYEKIKENAELERDKLRGAEKQLFEAMSKQREILGELDVISRKAEDLDREEREMKRELGEAGILLGREATRYEDFVLENEEEDRAEQTERKREIEKMKIRVEEWGAGGGEEVEREYQEVTERSEFLAREIADLKQSAETLRGIIEDLNIKLKREFDEGLKKINTKFQEFFSLIFGGGTASLALISPAPKKRKADDDAMGAEELLELGVAPEESPESGLDINLSLPHKRLRGIQMLSGGERTLVSVALVFAVSQVNPPPFLVLDETDAALDEANSKKYADMLADLSKSTQLLIITHNRETMSRAQVIYGITSGVDAVSKVLSIKFEDAEGMMAR